MKRRTSLKGKNHCFKELCRFADASDLRVEIEKPFSEFENLFLKVVNKDKEELVKVTLDNIDKLEKESAKLLNELSKAR